MPTAPVLASRRQFRLYNAGDRIQQTIIYSNPNGHDLHCVCRFNLDLRSESVSSLPEMMDVGGAIVHVHFADDVLRDFGDRGVVLIDANYEPPHRLDEENNTTEQIDTEADLTIPMARTEADAREKGARMWESYIDRQVRSYLEQCEQIRAGGGVPIAASGRVKHFLKMAGIVDPAEAMLVEAKKQTSAVQKLTEATTGQSETIAQLMEANRKLMDRLDKLEKKEEEPEPAGKTKR